MAGGFPRKQRRDVVASPCSRISQAPDAASHGVGSRQGKRSRRDSEQAWEHPPRSSRHAASTAAPGDLAVPERALTAGLTGTRRNLGKPIRTSRPDRASPREERERAAFAAYPELRNRTDGPNRWEFPCRRHLSPPSFTPPLPGLDPRGMPACMHRCARGVMHETGAFPASTRGNWPAATGRGICED